MPFTLRRFFLSCSLDQELSRNAEFASLVRINLKTSACKVMAVLCALCALGETAWTQALIPQGITQWSTQIKAGPVSIDMATGKVRFVGKGDADRQPVHRNLPRLGQVENELVGLV